MDAVGKDQRIRIRRILLLTKSFFRKIYALLPDKLSQTCLKYESGIIYIFYGGLTTVLNYVTHFAVRMCFSVSSACAASIAWVVGVLFAFFTNKYFVFETTSSQGIIKEFLKFTAGRLFTFFCEVALMWLFVDTLKFNELLVKLIVNILVIILNYIFSKIFVFKNNIQE